MSFLKKVVKEVKSVAKDGSSSSSKSALAQPAAAASATVPAASPPTSSKPAASPAANTSSSKPTSIVMPKASKNGVVAAPSKDGSRTPRTPADEGIAFFEGPVGRTEGPIQVFELELEADGSPTKEKSVRVWTA